MHSRKVNFVILTPSIKIGGNMKLKTIALALIFILLTAISPAAAGQHQWGASYFDWTGGQLNRVSKLNQVITPLSVAPKTYWSVNWVWANQSFGGYAGIQTSGARQNSIGDIAIFSLWNATEAVAPIGSWCTPFDGEGVGQSCRTNITVNPKEDYEIEVSADSTRGDYWWKASVIFSDGSFKDLGSIKASLPNLRTSKFGNFIEYFGEAKPCATVGLASAIFGIPITGTLATNMTLAFSRPSAACVNSWGEFDASKPELGAKMYFGGSDSGPLTGNKIWNFRYPFSAPEVSIYWLGSDLFIVANRAAQLETSSEVKVSGMMLNSKMLLTTPTGLRVAKLAPGTDLTIVTKTLAKTFVVFKKFSSCSQLYALFRGGVRSSDKAKNKGKAVRQNPTTSLNSYNLNKALDFDRDGIACER